MWRHVDGHARRYLKCLVCRRDCNGRSGLVLVAGPGRDGSVQSAGACEAAVGEWVGVCDVRMRRWEAWEWVSTQARIEGRLMEKR